MARMKKSWEFFKDGQRYLATCGESPKGFQNLLFVSFTGTVDKIEESLISRDNLNKMTRVDTVPSEWAKAFGARGVDIPLPPRIEEPAEVHTDVNLPRKLEPPVAVPSVAPIKIIKRRPAPIYLEIDWTPDNNALGLIGLWLRLTGVIFIIIMFSMLFTGALK